MMGFCPDTVAVSHLGKPALLLLLLLRFLWAEGLLQTTDVAMCSCKI